MAVLKGAIPWWSLPLNWVIGAPWYLIESSSWNWLLILVTTVTFGNLVGSIFFAAILVKCGPSVILAYTVRWNVWTLQILGSSQRNHIWPLQRHLHCMNPEHSSHPSSLIDYILDTKLKILNGIKSFYGVSDVIGWFVSPYGCVSFENHAVNWKIY